MIKNNIQPQSLLSTLWVFILFNMILRDLHEFPTEGFIEELMSLNLSDVEMLLYGFMVEIPIMMVLFSRILQDKVNKWVNIVAAIIALPGILSTLPSGDLDDIFFAMMSSMALVSIVLIARKWSLPTTPLPPPTPHASSDAVTKTSP